MVPQDKTMENLTIKLESVQAQREVTDTEYGKVCSKMYAEKQLIEDKYDKEIKGFESQLRDFDAEILTLAKQVKQEGIDEAWNDASSRPEISEFYLMAMLEKLVIRPDVDIKLKQTLSNGLDIWTIIYDGYGTPWKFYMAFTGTELVGTSFRETSQHAGDTTIPYSFIGQFEKPLTKIEENPYGPDREPNSTFLDWVRELKKLDQEDLPALPMNEGTLEEIRIGVNGKWSYYGWPDEDEENK